VDINKSFIEKIIIVLLIILLILAINFNVYVLGGTQTAFPQLNFIPIILMAYYFGTVGSLITALLIGIILGPFMPLNVQDNIMQSTNNWMVRIFVYSAISLVTGIIFQNNRKLNNEIIEKDSIDLFTGLFNQKKLFPLLDRMIDKNTEFHLIIIKINNLDQIEKYVNRSFVDKLTRKLIDDIRIIFNESELFGVHSDEFALVYKGNDENELSEKVKLLIEKNFTSVALDNYVFTMLITVGIYKINENEDSALSIYNKARVAVDQGDIYESGIYYYDNVMYNRRKLNFDVASSLMDSLINEEFYLVYQPVISLKDNKVIGSEILTRWDRKDNEPVGPQQFIDIAEKIGCISDFSLWIATEAINQILEWEKKDIIIDTAINITAKELLDKTFVKLIEEKIVRNSINRSLISIEITERVLAKEVDGLEEALNSFRSKGYKISIDDFGTGYNSLKFIGDIPFDILKIDKYFIDRLEKPAMKTLVANMIRATHQMNKKVIAEGIENEYQAVVLKSLGCDYAQGYHFSKPLLPNDFEDFYFKFNKIN